MDRGTWWATVFGVTESWTPLSTHVYSIHPMNRLHLLVFFLSMVFSCHMYATMYEVVLHLKSQKIMTD